MSPPLRREGTIVASAQRSSAAVSTLSVISEAIRKAGISDVTFVTNSLREGRVYGALSTMQINLHFSGIHCNATQQFMGKYLTKCKERSRGHPVPVLTVSSQNSVVLDPIHVIAAIKKTGLASLPRAPRKGHHKNRTSCRMPPNEGRVIN